MNDEGCPRSALLTQTPNPEARVDADMDTLATALYVRTDDLLKDSPQLARWRPAVGIDPALSDAELVTLAGACACICSPLCTACRPASRSPAPGPASARYCRASSMPDPELTSGRAGQILIGDKNYFGADFEAGLAGAGLTLLRPARKGEAERAGSRFFKPLRQTAESIFDT